MADNNALVIDAQGVCSAVRQVPSPNYDVRPDGVVPDMVVIHNIHLPPGEPGTTAFVGDAIERLFTNCLDLNAHECFAELSNLRVSAHFLIRRDGEIVQFVPCNLRAWHAGVSSWQGRERCNDFSIGIELEGSDFVPFEDIQYEKLNLLLNALQARYSITHLVGHNEIAPGRKTDPGPFFVWENLAPSVLELRQTGYIS